MSAIQIDIPEKQLMDFCQKWKISEFALFGSVLRQDFGPHSDIDVLITHMPGAKWNLYDLVHMIRELEAIFGRKVDLINRVGIEKSPNILLRQKILESIQVIHHAA